VHGDADINGVVEQLVEHALVDQLAVLVADAFCDELPSQRGGRADLEEALKDRANKFGIDLIDEQLAVFDLVSSGAQPPIHIPRLRDAANLSRIRSPITSRSRTIVLDRPSEI
jgi:hypothetical protein